MASLSNDKIYPDDEYLIILQKDDCDSEKELGDAMNLSNKCYFYRRDEYIEDEIDHREVTKEFISKYIKLINGYFESVDKIKVHLKVENFGVIIDGLANLSNNNLILRNDIIVKIQELRKNISTYFNRRLETIKTNQKFQENLSRVTSLMNLILARMEFGGENFKVSHFDLPKENKENITTEKQEFSEINLEPNLESKPQEINDESFPFEPSNEVKNLVETREDFIMYGGINKPNPRFIGVSDSRSGTESRGEGGENGDSDIHFEESDSEISQKSEPIIYRETGPQRFHKAITVINGGEKSNISSLRLRINEEKYSEIIKNYRSASKIADTKENVGTN
ncbi:hypothetical protein HWI79_1142 [Cryptosporidium felis]|nr:hypothetical protein HWI79_1142 [Cryptosporidium felis]